MRQDKTNKTKLQKKKPKKNKQTNKKKKQKNKLLKLEQEFKVGIFFKPPSGIQKWTKKI